MAQAKTQKKSFPFFSLCILVLTYFLILPTGILLTAGLLPTIMARITDRHPKQYFTFCIGCMNIAGTLPFVILLWQNEHSLEHTIYILSQQTSWLAMYGSAAIGMLIYSLMPSVMKILRLNQLNSKVKLVKKNQQKLLEIWGDKILPQEQKKPEE